MHTSVVMCESCADTRVIICVSTNANNGHFYVRISRCEARGRRPATDRQTGLKNGPDNVIHIPDCISDLK